MKYNLTSSETETLKMFDEKFAKIVDMGRGEYAITDLTGARFEAHTENGLVTEVGGLASIKDFLLTQIRLARADERKQWMWLWIMITI